MTTTLAPEKTTVLDPADGSHERFSHYVPKSAWERAYVWGEAATALCGKKWVPHNNPENHPVCPECKEKWEALKAA